MYQGQIHGKDRRNQRLRKRTPSITRDELMTSPHVSATDKAWIPVIKQSHFSHMDCIAHIDPDIAEESVSDQASSTSLDISSLSTSLGLTDDGDYDIDDKPLQNNKKMSKPLDLFLAPNSPQMHVQKVAMDKSKIKKSKKRKLSMPMNKSAADCGPSVKRAKIGNK